MGHFIRGLLTMLMVVMVKTWVTGGETLEVMEEEDDEGWDRYDGKGRT